MKQIRARILLLTSFACALLSVLACAGPDESLRPPLSAKPAESVILITVDTLRADALGFAGNLAVETPTLDRLAESGRVFDFAHAHSVTTLPSHASILTGLHPFEHGARHNGGYRLASEQSTLAERLREAGFATAAFVAAYPLARRFGLDQGFGTYDDELDESPSGPIGALVHDSERSGRTVVERSIEWWRSRSGQRRFLWLHLFEPHAPYVPPEPFATRFAENPYLGEVSATDFYLAPFLDDFLEGREEAPPLIVFTSDHGEALGEHGEQTHGLFAYESTLKVPLVLWGPGVETGRDQRVARHIDLLPTILEGVGEEWGDDLPGRSLLDAAGQHPKVSLFEAMSGRIDYGWAPLRGALVDRSKLVDLPIVELYDLQRDPREQTNVAAIDRKKTLALKDLMPDRLGRLESNPEVSSDEAARLRSLGYLIGPSMDRSDFGEADDPKNLLPLDHELAKMLELAAAGDFERAAELGAGILARRESMGVVYIYQTAVLLQLGDLEQAIAVMRRASSLDLAGPDLLGQLGLTLVSVGRPAEALEVLEPLVASEPEGEAAHHLALAYIRLGRHRDAEGLLRSLLEVEGATRTRTLENLCLLALAEERYEDAREWAEQALELDSRMVSSWNNLGVALFHLDQKAGAIKAWKRSLELAPEDADTLLNLGMVEAQLGNWREARKTLETFLAVARGSAFELKRQEARRLIEQIDAAEAADEPAVNQGEDLVEMK